LKEENLKKILLYLVSFSAGGLFGDAFIHLIPEAAEESGFGVHVSLYILLGIIASFIAEKFLQWRHCHIPTSKEHPHSFAYMNLFGDAVHNFIDGLIIGGSYLASVPLGIATTLWFSTRSPKKSEISESSSTEDSPDLRLFSSISQQP
jgi:zinc and cadmium transporter